MAKFIRPVMWLDKFTCPYCGTLSQQSWSAEVAHKPHAYMNHEKVQLERVSCLACKAVTYWDTDSKTPVFPRITSAPIHHHLLPKECVGDYEEARNIANESPRAAAALLRLCVQKLLIALGGKGRDLNADIGELVAKGLHRQVVDALDVCRIVGNNAVHPGEIDVKDDEALVLRIFELINYIVRETIEREQELGSLMGRMPQGAKDAIARRDRVTLSDAVSRSPQGDS